MEARLDDHVETSIALNIRIQTHFEKQQTYDAKHLSRLGLERAGWKSRFETKKAGSRLRLRNLRQQVRDAIAEQQGRFLGFYELLVACVLASKSPEASENYQTFQQTPSFQIPLVIKTEMPDVDEMSSAPILDIR
jgi:hypothetical protein